MTLAALLAGGCAATPEGVAERTPAPEASGREADSRMSAAGESLLVRSMSERRSGNYAAASATLERALRIEPAEPAIWLELARVRLLEGNFAQAEQLGRKAMSLTTDRDLRSEAMQVIEQALQRQKGDL